MIYEILKYPDERLKTVADEVTDFGTDELFHVIDSMIDTMKASGGIGLAATQVNIPQRVFVAKVQNKISAFINPQIIQSSFSSISIEEGCLSFPGIYARVSRWKHVTVRAQDVDGNRFEETYYGIDSVCIQHELDHLNGVLFIDNLTAQQLSEIGQLV